MLYIFFGKDQIHVREEALAHLRSLGTSESEVVKISESEYRAGMLAELAESASLFGGEQVILLDTPSSDAVFNEEVLASLALLKTSKNHFVVIEKGLLASPKKAYGAHAETVKEIATTEEKSTYNVFAFCDALLERDKKKLWMLMAQSDGVPTEEIVGVIFWQIKMLRLAERTVSPEEAGQKPYGYNKAKRALSKFKKGEVDALSRELIQLYHDGHQGKFDMRVGLERWMLGI